MKEEPYILLPLKGLPEVVFVDENGGKISKKITPEELLRFLASSVSEEFNTDWYESPYLPQRCVRYAWTDGMFKVMFYVPPHNQEIQYYELKIPDVPFPGLLFGFVVKGSAVTQKRVVAIRDDTITDDTPLYRYPYSNVYGEGDICWKGLPEILEIRHTEILPDLFFATSNNLDLYPGANSSGLEYRQLMETYQGKEFPKEFLIKRHETVKDFWNRL